MDPIIAIVLILVALIAGAAVGGFLTYKKGVAAGVATGIILVNLKDYNVISLLPIIVAAACMIAFLMSLRFPKIINMMGKQEKDVEKQ